MLEEDTINILVNRIGYKAYKKFDKAYWKPLKL
jgi:hypothetical protein